MSRPPADPADSTPDQGPARGQDGTDGTSRQERPGAVAVISGIVAAEATALLGAAVWYGYNLFVGSPVLSFWGAVFTLALLVALSAWLYAVALFHFRGYRWTRAAALVAQLFALTIGFPTLGGGLPALGAAMVVPAVLALVLLFSSRVIGYASRTGGAPPAL